MVYNVVSWLNMGECMCRRFGTWLVGMLEHGKSRTILEGPVCEGEKVIGWHTNEKSKRLRRFHVDMSGFAFNSTILWDPRRWRRPTLEPIRQLDIIKEGFQVSALPTKLGNLSLREVQFLDDVSIGQDDSCYSAPQLDEHQLLKRMHSSHEQQK